MSIENGINLGSIRLKLGSNTTLKKASLSTLLVIGLVMGAAAPFWFTGGFVSNAHLVKNQMSVAWPGWRLGSKMMFVRAGQTILVNVEVHEVKTGGVRVYVREKTYTNADERGWARKEITSPGKATISLKAKTTGIYEVEFDRASSYGAEFNLLTPGKCDVRYSADWDVL